MKSEEKDKDSDEFPEITVFSRNLNNMAMLLQSSLITIGASAFSANLISSDLRDAVSDAKAGHALTYTSRILQEVLKSIESSENPEEILEKFIIKVVMKIGGSACKEVARKLRKLYSMINYMLFYEDLFSC